MSDIYFGTNRNPKPAKKPTDFGKNFSKNGLADLRFGKAVVNGNNVTIQAHSEKLVQVEGIQQTDSQQSKLGSHKLFAELRSKMREAGSDTLVFIHGYNVTFKEALITGSQLAINHRGMNDGRGVNVICFSWPSDGSMMPWKAYSSDRQDAAASGPAFARGLLKVAEFLQSMKKEDACDQKIHLVAHSMGNYVLRHALQEVKRQSGSHIPRIFDQIFLAAPDEDDDAFEHEHKLKLLPRLGRRVNVYFNRGDNAMSISDGTKGNPDRLGDDGPRAPTLVPGKVSQIDCSMVVDGLIEHSYFIDEQRVVRDISQVLNGVDPMEVEGRKFLVDRSRFIIQE